MKEADIALALVLVGFAVRGFLRGFFREGFGLLALGSAILSAFLYTEPVASAIAERVGFDAVTRSAVVFVGIFVLVHTAINLFGLLLDRVAHSLLFRSVSCVTGAAFGALKGLVFAGFILLFLQMFPLVPVVNERVERSRFARPLATIAGTVVRDYWRRPTVPNPSPEV